ncbi:hypothetical protein A3709_20300 [Halioglobus sp. HI00S01]|uniref:hypothetical protein n=1 Tax=Halioglobus sp. HI00S01 TaxID=1822214 RepID=UPI0007C32F0D|nr:hypothetical protein [Halioglobus sp. HI00S01]KZX57955.1 hypothetical protein A3709_20300 [Halioglobus sp. HI00S01]
MTELAAIGSTLFAIAVGFWPLKIGLEEDNLGLGLSGFALSAILGSVFFLFAVPAAWFFAREISASR